MTNTKTTQGPTPSQGAARISGRTTIPASDVGVTLTTSKRALEELERIHDETIKAAQEAQKFSLR